MTTFSDEHELYGHFREMAEQDRQLTRWGWYRRNDYRPPTRGWRFRLGQALICIGQRMQEQGANAQRRVAGS